MMSSIAATAASATPPVTPPAATSTATSDLPARADYPHFLSIATRWMDNDVYGHVNNVVYYSYFDTVINEHLIRAGGLDINHGIAGDGLGIAGDLLNGGVDARGDL